MGATCSPPLPRSFCFIQDNVPFSATVILHEARLGGVLGGYICCILDVSAVFRVHYTRMSLYVYFLFSNVHQILVPMAI